MASSITPIAATVNWQCKRLPRLSPRPNPNFWADIRAVSHATHNPPHAGVDQSRLSFGFGLATQVTHIDLERIARRREVETPHTSARGVRPALSNPPRDWRSASSSSENSVRVRLILRSPRVHSRVTGSREDRRTSAQATRRRHLSRVSVVAVPLIRANSSSSATAWADSRSAPASSPATRSDTESRAVKPGWGGSSPVLRRNGQHFEPVQPGHHHVQHQGVGLSLAIRSRASRPSCASSTEVVVEGERPTQGIRARARSSSTTDNAHSHSVYPSPETDLRCSPEPPRRTRPVSAAVEINKAEAGGLEKAPRQLVLLAATVTPTSSGALGLPLRAPGYGCSSATSCAWGNSHDGISPLRGLLATRGVLRGNCPSG